MPFLCSLGPLQDQLVAELLLVQTVHADPDSRGQNLELFQAHDLEVGVRNYDSLRHQTAGQGWCRPYSP